jgi:hypothetical protein
MPELNGGVFSRQESWLVYVAFKLPISNGTLASLFLWLMLGSSRLRELCECIDEASGIDGNVLCIDCINISSAKFLCNPL